MENLKDDSRDISRAWENIRDNKKLKINGQRKSEFSTTLICRRVTSCENIVSFNIIYVTDKTPEEWRKGTVIPIDTKDSKQRVENCSLLQVFHQALNELSSAQLNIDLTRNIIKIAWIR